MCSLEIFIENINKLASYQNLLTYKEIADYLNVSVESLKQWKRKARCPSLEKIDQICNKIGCYTYSLLQRNSDLTISHYPVDNNSRDILIRNLEHIFTEKGCFSWSSRTALFYHFVSEDMLKSYFKKKNYKVPPLNRLDEMASALGIPTYQLLMEK